MDETPEQTGKRLRLQTAILEDDVDYDWRYMDERVEKLEEIAELLDPSLLQEAIGLVVMQVYLNRMRRSWMDLEEPDDDDARAG